MDVDTFLTTVYVLIADACHLPAEPAQPGRAPALSREEALTLATFGQCARVGSEAAFYRWVQRHLRAAFPTLPSRPQFNRLQRRWHDALAADWLDGRSAAYQVIDTTGVATRNSKRRGTGWLAGY